MRIRAFIILIAFSALASAISIMLLGLFFSPEQAGFLEKSLIFISLFFLISAICCLGLYYVQSKFSKKQCFQQVNIAFTTSIIIGFLIIIALLIKVYLI